MFDTLNESSGIAGTARAYLYICQKKVSDHFSRPYEADR